MVGAVLKIPESVRCVHRDLFQQSRISRAGALISAAEKIGLDRKSARVAAAHALADGIAYGAKANLLSTSCCTKQRRGGRPPHDGCDEPPATGKRRCAAASGMKQAAKNARVNRT